MFDLVRTFEGAVFKKEQLLPGYKKAIREKKTIQRKENSQRDKEWGVNIPLVEPAEKASSQG